MASHRGKRFQRILSHLLRSTLGVAVLKYIELKGANADDGAAWVARVRVSKSGRTTYFNGKALSRVHRPAANHQDAATGETYWISAIKPGGFDRRWTGSRKVAIETGAIERDRSSENP